MEKITANITKDEYSKLYDVFLNAKGYMTKLINKGNNNEIVGYLIRAEIPTNSKSNVFVALTFQPADYSINYMTPATQARFNKAIGISRVLVGGKRLLKRIKPLSKFKSQSILSNFISPDTVTEDVLDYFNNNGFNYNEFYNYIIAFENKIKKYYTGKNVKIVLV